MPKRRSNNPAGRPSQGLTQTQVPLRMPAILAGVVTEMAQREGVSREEWIRRAIRHRAWPVFEAYVYAEPETVEVPCPFGEPGDRLWVRETWATPRKDKSSVWYRAGHVGVEPKWRPSIHMPRWASRITLEVTGVRVERLQAITEFDAIAEGVENTAEFRWRDYMPEREAPAQTHSSARESFLSLWESINGTESLAANPWVWVVSFERVTP